MGIYFWVGKISKKIRVLEIPNIFGGLTVDDGLARAYV